MKALLFALFAVGALELATCLLSIPDNIRDGFPYRQDISGDAPVVIDIFLDVTCPDSKAAFPVVKQVADHYGSQVLLRAFMFPLPFHRASFLACRSTFAVNSINSSLTYDWMKAVFDQQGKLYNSATADMGDVKIMGILGGWSTSLGMEADDFIKKAEKSNWDQVLQWKYGCSRGVYGTPTAFVNDDDVDVQTKWTLEDWVKVIQPYLVTAQEN